MNSVLGQWRESKVRPIPGNAPHDRPVSRGMISPSSIGDDAFRTTRFPPHSGILPGPSVGVFKAWRNLSGPMGYQNQTLARDPTASRRSAPSQGQRTRREDRAPSHRPQMSSGRLFLDRVGRHQSPSPLHRHPQHNSLAFPHTRVYHRTVRSVLTVCLSRGDKRTVRSQYLQSGGGGSAFCWFLEASHRDHPHGSCHSE